MLLVENTALRIEIRQQREKIEELQRKLSRLQSIVDVAGVAKVFSQLAPQSIYRGLFTGSYRNVILGEVIARYQQLEMEGPADRKTVIAVMNAIGRESSRGMISLVSGEKIRLSCG